MEPEKTIRISRPAEEPEQREVEPEVAAASEIEEPKAAGLGARLRQLVEQAKQGGSRPGIKREQLKQNRTKSFLVLAGSMVFMALLFFALYSSPSNNHRNNSAHPNTPNLGRGPGNGKAGDDGHSVTPLLSADTRNPNDEPLGVTPEEIRNTARRSALANASPSFGPPLATPPPSQPPPAPKDYALNRIDFPAEPPADAPTAAPQVAPEQDKLTKASLVFVRASTGSRESATPIGVSQPVLERVPHFNALPAGTRLIARLETPVSTAVKAPVVAAIEYNYERDGEIVIPAGSKAFGELDQSNNRGFVGIRFHSLQMPDETEMKIEGRSMSLEFQPLKGKVTGKNAGKRFLVGALTGVGTIAAATVGVQGGLGVNNTISNNVLLRERLADNMALSGDQQLTELAYRQNIVVTVAGNTRFYIVLAKPSDQTGPARSGPANNSAAGGLGTTALPSVQEIRELMELKGELTQMYQQQQQKALLQTAAQTDQQE
jgi:Bacterial conjugation TrbI-like protein